MIYEYRCPDCSCAYTSTVRDNTALIRCNTCGEREMQRVWSVNVAPVFQEQFSQSTGQVVSSHKGFREQLARASDEASERTGFEHRYVEVSPEEARPRDQ